MEIEGDKESNMDNIYDFEVSCLKNNFDSIIQLLCTKKIFLLKFNKENQYSIGKG